MAEAYEIIFPYNKHHSETCPRCNPDNDDESVPMVRRSPDVYECETCGLLILAGWDRYKMSKRILLGNTIDTIAEYVSTDKIKPKPKEK